MAVTEYTWNPLTDSVIEETDGAGNVLVEYTNEPAPYGPLISERRGSATCPLSKTGVGLLTTPEDVV